MAKPGRKPKPTALKLVEGNPGKRPINENEPKPAKAWKPRAPRGLSKTEQAKWRQMCRVLATMRVLTVIDLDALEMYCRNWCLMHQALKSITDEGMMIESKSGAKIYNPAWSQYKHAEAVCRKLQVEFGMTPSSRSGVIAGAGDDGKGNWSDF